MSAAAVLPGLEHEPSEVRDRAADLLSRPPFDQDEGVLARAWATLREWAAEGLDRVLGLVAGDAAVAWVVVVLGVALLLVVVWRATRGLSLDQAVVAEPTTTGGGRSAAQWEAMATEHERAQRYDEAVRARYLALVTWLVEQGVVEEVPGRTVGELDRELELVAPGVADLAAQAGAVFGEVYYGRRPASRAQAERVAELARAVGRETGALSGAVGSRP